jgi:predicted PurR-regulated permease PerM
VRWRNLIGKSSSAAAAPEPRTVDEQRLLLQQQELEQLRTVFSAPKWLEDIGRSSWLLTGFFLVVAGIAWLLGATQTITGPVIAGTVVAAVTIPIVSALQRKRVPRAAGAAIVLLTLIAVVVGIFILVLAGVRDQSGSISGYASAAASKAQKWLQDAGVNESSASATNESVSRAVPNALQTLLHGIVNGIRGIASLALGLSFFALAVFFLLKDGPSLRGAVDKHLGVPEKVAQTITGGVIRSLRGYFKGVTIVAAFNGVVVTLGALILGVPLAGTIGVVTFVTAYIPYIGAFVAGAFAVIIALGAQGTTTALLMLVVVILANGLLQNIFQPFAMGAALNLHPLVVLIITISAGCIFGALGLILAAPLTSAAVHIRRDLARAKEDAALEQARGAPPPEPATS